MKRRQFTPEKIIGLLRQAEVELAQRKRAAQLVQLVLTTYIHRRPNNSDNLPLQIRGE
jgi:hypothetical protein